jgi:pilus assembly protein CpaF
MMVGMTGFDLPMWVIRRQIASAIHVIVQATRLPGGARKVVKISEVTGVEGDNIAMHDLFVYKQTGIDDQQRAQGYFHATGLRSHFLERLAAAGVPLPQEMFERRLLSPGRASRPDAH